MLTENIEELNKFINKVRISTFDTHRQFVDITKNVANIPWGDGRTINEVLTTKKMGTCTGKHLLLKSCYDALGIVSRPVVCTFRWSDQTIQYPDNIKLFLAKGEWEHGHNYLQVMTKDGNYIDVDVTFQPSLQKFGFKTFPERWNGITSTNLAFDNIVRKWVGVDISSKKNELIESLSPELKVIRENFLSEFIKWAISLKP